jgi:MFS family permease
MSVRDNPEAEPIAPSRRARGQLALVALLLVLTMATWFAASAVAPALRAQWSLSSGQVTWLTSSVQLGFVTGALISALLNLPDIFDPARVAAGAAFLAGASTAAMNLATGLGSAFACRFVTGIALAGVYPVGMKLASSWYRRGRGLAISILIGALTLGSALPQLIGGALASAWRETMDVAAGLSVLGGLICLALVKVGPHTARADRFHPGYLFRLVREPAPRLANLGYLGHMWELYATWVWLPAILAESLTRHGSTWSRSSVATVSFLAIGVCGVLGCLVAGWAGERVGRAAVAATAMTTSGCCCLTAALAFGRNPVLLAPVVALWGGSVIADSALFSACLSSVVDRSYVGTALTVQTAAGFLLTIVSIQGFAVITGWAGWPVAIALLGIGPLLGAAAMRRLAGLLPAASQ